METSKEKKKQLIDEALHLDPEDFKQSQFDWKERDAKTKVYLVGVLPSRRLN